MKAGIDLRRGKKVIIVGRTESSLEKTAGEIGATAYYTLDTGSTSSIPTRSVRR
jgi:short-subunit dehydrogenase